MTTFAAIAGIFVLTPESEAPARTAIARTVAADVQARDDAMRTRASSAPPASAAAPLAPLAAPARHDVGFAPRPTPYGHGSSAKP